ncbi:hypothetical protein ACNKHX_07595 [Shigella flexneri]
MDGVISVKACRFIVRRSTPCSVKEVIGQKSNGNPEKVSQLPTPHQKWVSTPPTATTC